MVLDISAGLRAAGMFHACVKPAILRDRSMPRVGACVCAAVIAVGLSQPVWLKPVQAADPNDRKSAETRLQKNRDELKKTRERMRQITADVGGLVDEHARLNERLVETGANVQKIEARMTDLEARISQLGQQRDDLRKRLSAENRSMTRLLGAMQRMGRDPPPVIFTRRTDALGMVRSGMLLAKAFPELKGRAERIGGQIRTLAEVLRSHHAETRSLQVEARRLSDARTELASLIETKRQSLAVRRKELADLNTIARTLSRSVTDMQELLARLDRAVAQNTRLGSYNAELPPDPAAAGSPKILRPSQKGSNVAALTPPNAVELAPLAGEPAQDAGRLEPAFPFYQVKGKLRLPAAGARLIGFGDRTQYGGRSKGMIIKTRSNAQITSPSDGWVVFAGAFRSYGKLLIINAGAGYHIVLAGLSRIDVQLGQFVLASEPVGSMPGRGERSSDMNAPALYVEFRKDNRPIDPGPWWAKDQQKVQG